MKKFITLLAALTLVGSFTACSKTTPPAETQGITAAVEKETTAATEMETTAAQQEETSAAANGETSEGSPAAMVLADFKEKMASGESYTAEELANVLVTNEQMPFAGAAMAVEPGFLNGFSAEIEGFAEGAMFSPMIGSIPFVGYIFNLEEGADTAAFMETLKSNADLRWNICTQADEMVCEAEGQTVFFVMAPASFDE